MKKKSHRKPHLIFSLVFLLAAVLLLTPPMEAFSAGKEVVWNVSVWGGKRAGTLPWHDYAADMEKKTGGLWKFKFHYGSVLAPAKEQLDGIKAGMFEAAFFAPAYAPAKTPLHTVHEMPFIAPSDNVHMGKLWIELWNHPAMKKELLKWDAVGFLPNMLPTYNIMGNKAIRTVADLKGLRIRVGGEASKVLKEFGAVPTLVPAPEVYETLARGTLDAVTLPWTFAFGAYKIHEVSKYACLISLNSLSMLPVAKKTAWDALPDEWKKYHMQWYHQAPEKWAAGYKKADDKWMPIFEKKLTFIKFPDSEREKLVAKANEFYDKWASDREKEGLPGREILDFYLKKRKEIAGY